MTDQAKRTLSLENLWSASHRISRTAIVFGFRYRNLFTFAISISKHFESGPAVHVTMSVLCAPSRRPTQSDRGTLTFVAVAVMWRWRVAVSATIQALKAHPVHCVQSARDSCLLHHSKHRCGIAQRINWYACVVRVVCMLVSFVARSLARSVVWSTDDRMAHN